MLNGIFLIISQGYHTNYLLFWALCTAGVLGLAILLVWQYRQGKRLKSDLNHMDKMYRHSVEHEMVLKSMKLSAWRLDARTREITYESDYRDSVDSYTPAPGEKIEKFVQQLAPKDAERIYKVMNDICDGTIEEYTLQYQVKIGNTDNMYWSESYAMVAERYENGKPKTIVGASMRIDKRKQMERALIEARNKAEESDRLKSAFLASISHEIRTPLNAIVGFSEVLPMTESEEERQGLIDLIHENNSKMLRIFENIVNMSKVEAGKVEYTRTEFSLNNLLRQTGEKYKADLGSKPVAVEYEFSGDDIKMFTDNERVGVILGHFMSNAVKFTNVGTISLGYSLHPDGGIRIYVRDTGCGIPREEMEHVFDRFVKLDDFSQGMGLGLSISRSFAYSLGGKVGLESQFNEGSTFWLDLPPTELK